MAKQKQNPNSIDPTEYPLNKVPQIVEHLEGTGQYPEEPPIDEGIIEEQQGDLEGLDGENTVEPGDEEEAADTVDNDDIDPDSDEA